MSDRYPVVDLTSPPSLLEARPTVDPSALARELKDITDGIAPVIATGRDDTPFGLESVEVALTIGAEGGLAFVAKGSAEASITVRFSRNP
jgi:hypothetical protein